MRTLAFDSREKNQYFLPITFRTKNFYHVFYHIFRIIHAHGYTQEDCDKYKTVIYTNTTSSIITIIRAMPSLGIRFANDENYVNTMKESKPYHHWHSLSCYNTDLVFCRKLNKYTLYTGMSRVLNTGSTSTMCHMWTLIKKFRFDIRSKSVSYDFTAEWVTYTILGLCSKISSSSRVDGWRDNFERVNTLHGKVVEGYGSTTLLRSRTRISIERFRQIVRFQPYFVHFGITFFKLFRQFGADLLGGL